MTTRVTWKTPGMDGAAFESDVDADRAAWITHDGAEIAASIAKLIAQDSQGRLPPLETFSDGEGPVVEILSPADHAGVFRISVGRTVRKGKTVLGSSAMRIEPMTEEEREEYLAALAAFTDPQDVEGSYELLGNRYGHWISGSENEAEDLEIEALQKAFDSAVLHDCGWPARSKASGKIGFLADTTFWNGEPAPGPEALAAFRRETGFVAQPISKWAGRDASFLVCFVPASRLDRAAETIEALNDLVRPAPAPGRA